MINVRAFVRAPPSPAVKVAFQTRLCLGKAAEPQEALEGAVLGRRGSASVPRRQEKAFGSTPRKRKPPGQEEVRRMAPGSRKDAATSPGLTGSRKACAATAASPIQRDTSR
ncbi:Extended synaptotagmin-3 [Varanus komodoensis]|nr:Extended synaptotagmin-3 [Varanus komodoensis]